MVVLRTKLFGQEQNSFAKELFITVCDEMFLIQRIQDANWIPVRFMSVLIAVESTYSGVMVEPNGTTTFRVLMVLNAEYEVSCGILDTQ